MKLLKLKLIQFKPRQVKLGILTFLSIFVLSTTPFFSNCSFLPLGFEVQTEGAMSLDLPMNHPNLLSVNSSEEVSFKPQLMDRLQVYSHLRAILVRPEMPQGLIDFIDWVLDEEILGRSSDFGRACDLTDPLFSEQVPGDCRFSTANATTDRIKPSSISREASRIQACRRTIGHDEVARYFRDGIQSMAKVAGAAPTNESVKTIHGLFFLGQEIPGDLVTRALDLYEDMGRNGETLNDRWKMLFLIFCESPDWQYL
jgi:hypothetical protein